MNKTILQKTLVISAVIAAALAGCGENGNPGGTGTGGDYNNNNSNNNNNSGNGAIGTKIIGGKTWTTENLNIETDSSWCYNDSLANCAKYGRLYAWTAAVNACPMLGSGWRLPDTSDWNELVIAAGGTALTDNRTLLDILDGKTISSEGAENLKAEPGWAESYKPWMTPNSTGFSALPGGMRPYLYDGGFFDFVGLRNFGNWWTSTETAKWFTPAPEEGRTEPTEAYIREMRANVAGHVDGVTQYTKIYLTHSDKRNAYSVRCVQD